MAMTAQQYPAPGDKRAIITWCYENLGWHFILLDKRKRPIQKNWQAIERMPLDEILAHQGNIGLKTGASSGLTVVDIDDGADITGLELPDTVEVITGSGGRHLYYNYVDGLKNSASKLTLHVDIRSDGGQVVFAGSIHPVTQRPYIMHRAPWVHALADLPQSMVDLAMAEKKTASRANKTKAPIVPVRQNRRVKGYARTAMKLEVIAVQSAADGQRNDILNRAAFSLGQLVAGGELARGDVEAELMAAAQQVGLGDNESWATIQSGLAAGEREPRQCPVNHVVERLNTEQRDNRPVVLTPGLQIDDQEHGQEQGVADFAHGVLDALPEKLIYTKSDIPGELVGEPGELRWSELSENRMRLLIDTHIRLVQWSENKKTETRSPKFKHCVKDWAGVVLAAAANSPKSRELVMLAKYPVFLRGWKLCKPGWNDGGIYYDEPDDLRGIEPNMEIEEIRSTLDDLLSDFPFADIASRHNYFGLLVTPLIMHAIDGNRPLHLITASLERTGKSKLAEDMFGGIILGEPTPAMQVGGSDEERDKRILALLLQGGTLVHLDNLPRKLDSAALASFLTAKTYQGRMLGGSRILSLPNNLTAVATGNNTICSGEIAKRIVPIVLQPKTSTPEDRTQFAHPDLRGHIAANRRHILECVLGMIQLWVKRGCPPPPSPRPFGGFECWAAAVHGILEGAMLHQWRKNEKAWRAKSDSDGEQREALVEAWWADSGTALMTAKDVLRIADEAECFDWIFSIPSPKAQQTRIGNWLRLHTDTPIGRWIIRAQKYGSHNCYFLQEQK